MGVSVERMITARGADLPAHACIGRYKQAITAPADRRSSPSPSRPRPSAHTLPTQRMSTDLSKECKSLSLPLPPLTRISALCSPMPVPMSMPILLLPRPLPLLELRRRHPRIRPIIPVRRDRMTRLGDSECARVGPYLVPLSTLIILLLELHTGRGEFLYEVSLRKGRRARALGSEAAWGGDA